MRRRLTAAIRAGRGRWAALAVLALLLPLLALPDHSPLERLRLVWLDFYQYAIPRAARSEAVTIVEIDERALRKLGQWPWPRDQLAELVRRIGEAGAIAIGLDIVMPEPDRMSPETVVARLQPHRSAALSAFLAFPGNDARLAQVIGAHRVVLGAAGSDARAGAPETPLLVKAPVLVRGGAPDTLRRYDHKLLSLPVLQQAAAGQGLLNADLERGVVRRVPLVSSIDGTLLPNLSLELVRVAVGAPAVRIEVHDGAVEQVQAGEVVVPTQPNATMWIHFSRSLARRYLPALEVLEGDIQAQRLQAKLRGKIVIVGVTGLGFTDQRVTARGDTVPGTEVHAQMIESFFERRFLHRPGWMPAAEAAAFAVLGGLLVAFAPRVRRGSALLLAGSALALLAAMGFALFVWKGWLFDAASLGLALFAVFATLFASALLQADHERRASQRSLRLAREAAARLDGELQAARRIQLGIVPGSAARFPGERRFELAATLEPARSVGGDLYDFFMLDADRLFFHIADVSGKGIPASLFMVITKALLKSIALRAGRAASDPITEANVEIARDNPESLFVTAFAAVLDVNDGELRYWTAGHDTPLLFEDGEVSQLDRTQSGPPLCVIDDYCYPPQRWRLAPGSLLVLFTDGVPEAQNAAGELYGKERLVDCLRNLPRDVSASATLQALQRDLEQFVAGAPASDDVCLLVLRWLGPDAALSAP
jgi:serine phosphatase RsbU (regulator of sigma subunit)/CHASE2 domain-containing sensor protein